MQLPGRLLSLADAVSEVRYFLYPFFVNHFRSIWNKCKEMVRITDLTVAKEFEITQIQLPKRVN